MKTTDLSVMFVGEAVTAAHVIRPLGLARGLGFGKWDVTFACDRRCEEMVRREGLAYEPLASISREVFLSRLDRGAALYTVGELQSYVQEDLRAIAAVKPDVIIGDFRISMGISAELCGVPYLALSNAHWSPNSRLPLPVPEHPLTVLLGVTMAGRVIGTLVPYFFKLQARAMNQLRKWYGLAPIRGRGAPDVYTHGTRTLYLDAPELYGRMPLGPREQCIGPVLWAPEVSMPEWWNRLPSDRPVVWLSAGSSGDGAALARAAQILVGSGLTVMASTAGRLEGMPASVYQAPFIPGLAAAERADLIVCNGGSGLVYQALAKGKPVLGIPRNMDQYYVMEAVQRYGAGRVVRSGTMTGDAVRKASRDLLTDSAYGRAAQKLAQAIAGMNPVQRLEERVCGVVAEKVDQIDENIARAEGPVWDAETVGIAVAG